MQNEFPDVAVVLWRLVVLMGAVMVVAGIALFERLFDDLRWRVWVCMVILGVGMVGILMAVVTDILVFGQ